MATWFTDVALAQVQYNNFPGAPGMAQIVQPPTWQNNALFEAVPPMLLATYVLTGNEVANDIIQIAVLNAGTIVEPGISRVTTGLTAPGVTFTIAIGDNDLGALSNLPIPNQSVVAQIGQADSLQAPTWVSGTAYVAGNVALDATTAPVNETFTALIATSGTTAPRSAANTTWMPNRQRYSNSISIAGGAANVAFAGGTQMYGTPPSICPFSIIPGQSPTGYVASTSGLFQQYQIQNDCWLQAKVLTTNVLVANTVLVFRVGIILPN